MESGTRERERLRWRSRRGLLEMDLILQRFLDRHLATLSVEDTQAYDVLLDLPDNDFLDLVMGRAAPADGRLGPVLEKIRQS
ncbi:MAG: succinate dehydrogenase assembly factor 2 [Betaproteobacteria bacterium]|nr:succinate dehydrogenase assembly factor 2 [Betaproteobacteria bacterium]MDE1981094.1 succinate dehydrogenase assembly factor 2 [Betaproteobacteria bacterium]MDE2353868.1 succinate dehydrogenase assembly factor 2 [Betaproteobacteria bacterium]